MKYKNYLLAFFLFIVTIFTLGETLPVSQASNNELTEITYFENIRFSVNKNAFDFNEKTFTEDNCSVNIPKGIMNTTLDSFLCSDVEDNYVYEFRVLRTMRGFTGANTEEKFAEVLTENLLIWNDEALTDDYRFYLLEEFSLDEFSYSFDKDFGCEIFARVNFRGNNGKSYNGYIKVIDTFNGSIYVYLVGYSKNSDMSDKDIKKIVSSLNYNESYEGTLLNENSQYYIYDKTLVNYPITALYSTIDYNILQGDFIATDYGNLVGAERVIYFEANSVCSYPYSALGSVTDKNGNTWEKYLYSDRFYYYFTKDTVNNRIIAFKFDNSNLCNGELFGDNYIKNLSFNESFESLNGEYLNEKIEGNAKLCYENIANAEVTRYPRRAFLMELPLYNSLFNRDENKPLYDSIYGELYINKIYNEDYEGQEAVATTEEIIEPTTEAVIEPIATPTDVVVPETTETPNTEAQTPVETPTTEIIEQENTSSEAESESVSK